MAREPQLGVVVGKKGVGKTHTTKETIRRYIKGNPEIGIKPRRVLILDANDEFVEIKSIALSDVARFSSHPRIEARRVRPFRKDGVKMKTSEIAEMLNQVLEVYKGGLLLIEDINKYVSDNMPGDVIGAICTNRHSDLDIIIHYQSIGRITPKVWQNLNWIRFHANTDSVYKHRIKYEDKLEILSITEIIVKQACVTNPRFFCYVDIDLFKIVGDITPQMRDAAIERYFEENYSTTIQPMLNQRSFKAATGDAKKYTAATAYKKLSEEAVSSYFK